MANPYLILWADPTANKLYSGWKQNTEARTPIVKQGDEVGVELHWVQRGSFTSTMQEVEFPPAAAITLAIGRLDAAPTGGTFTITYGANTTPALDYDITATALQTALNALASITAEGGVTVTKSGIQFRIIWNNQAVISTAMTADVDAIYPTSNADIVETKAGSATSNRIILFKVKQAFIAACQTWTPTPSPTITTTNVYGNTWRMSVYPYPKEGVYSIIITDGATNKTTAPLAGDADETTILSALNTLGVSGSFTVVRSGDYSMDIGVPASVTNVQTQNGLVGFSSMYGVLDMNTAEVEEFLAGSESGTATLEVQTDISGEIQTLIRTNIQVLNNLIDISSFNIVDLGSYMPAISAVRFDTAQALTTGQQTQARANINAVDGGTISTIQSDITALDGRVTATEGHLDQDVKVASDVTFKSLEVTSLTGNPFQFYPAGNGNKLFVDSTGVLNGEYINTTLQYYMTADANNGVLVSNWDDSISTKIAHDGLTLVGASSITFSDSTVQSTAFVPNDYLSKNGNLSGISNTAIARTNLGLGTIATASAGDYLTSASAASTYLTITTAASTYAPVADQTVNTTDNVRFAQVAVGVAAVLETKVTASGFLFNSTNEIQDIAHSAGTTVGGGTGLELHADNYPDEISIVVNGTTYRVPARVL